jgi:cation:H+ antiporter
MSILLSLVLLVVGATGLVAGGEVVVRSATAIARRFGVSDFAIGATVVAIGTSLPELVVSLSAAVRGYPDIAIGNVFGSNIANVGLVLGLAAVIRPVRVRSAQTPRTTLIYVIVLALLAAMLVFFPWIGWIHGLVLLAAGFGFVAWLYRAKTVPGSDATSEPSGDGGQQAGFWTLLLAAALAPLHLVLVMASATRPLADGHGWWVGSRERAMRIAGVLVPETNGAAAVVFLLVGLALLVIGGEAFVRASVSIAEFLGVSDLVIGLVVVAVGTSLPELAVSVVAAVKGQGDMSIGNIVGSNLFNLFLVLGGSSLITRYRVDIVADPMQRATYVLMMVTGLLMFVPVFVCGKKTLGRAYGIVLLALYAVGVSYWFLTSPGR